MRRIGHTKRNRGIGTVLGTIIFVIVIISLTGSIVVWGTLRYADYIDAVNKMDLLDIQKQGEDVSISEVLFADSSQYTNTTTPTAGAGTANRWPVTNMNVTDESGWTFTREFPTGVTVGMSGGVDLSGVGRGAVGSSSGPGILFVGVSYLPTSGTATFTGNWTIQSFVDLEELGVSDGSYFNRPSDVVNMSFSRILPRSIWNSVIDTVSQTIYLINETGYPVTVDTADYASVGDSDSSWNYTTGILVTGGVGERIDYKFWGRAGSPQWVTLTISTAITVKVTTDPADVVIYYDDIGLRFDFSGFINTANATLIVPLSGGEDTSRVTRLFFNYASAYNISSVNQILYIYDASSGRYIKFSESSVSTTSVNTTITISGPQVQNYIDSSDEVRFKIVSSHYNRFRFTTSRLTLQDFFSDKDHVSVIFENSGETTARIVSLWIIDSSDHTNYNSTTFDEFVPAGSSVIVTISHTWVSGENTVRVVTERGNIASREVQAG